MVNKNLFLMLFIVVIIGSVAAQDYYAQGSGVDLRISCNIVNCSNGIVNITVLNPNNTLLVDNQSTTKYNGYVLYNLNLETEGSYSSFLASDNYSVPYNFVVTESGVEITSPSLILGLLAILVIFFFASVLVMFIVDNYIAKFTLYWVSHLLFIIITFIGWQVGVEGLLIGTSIIGIFYWLFLITSIAVFPMVILSIAWIVYIHLYNEHMEKLIDKGEDPETAFALTKKKYGGWFSGK